VKQKRRLSHHTGWLLLAVIVQAAIGAGMIPIRYLQVTVGLPALAIVAVSDLVAFSVMSWRTLPRVDRTVWRSKTLWLMVGIVLVRTVLVTLSLRFTQAYLVQLINLLAPFMVVFFDRLINRTKLPKFTLLAISLCLVGGALLIFGGLSGQPLAGMLTPEDGLGILLAFLGTIGIAAYMVIIKHSEQVGLPFEAVYISQVGTLALTLTLLSFAVGEDWSTFRGLDIWGGLALAFNAIGLEVGLKVGNITVLRKLGAPLVSSMLAVRLVAALLMGWLILAERPESPLQWAGAAIVALTITWYLSKQRHAEPAVEIE
jgi:drug/metabolite transporter (DMT)-like permease